MQIVVVALTASAAASLLAQPGEAAQLQLVPGQPVVARCPAQTGNGTSVQARFSSGTLYCEYTVQVAPSCPSTHAFFAVQQGADRCYKVAQMQTGPNSYTTLHVDPIAPSCPANHLLIVDAASSPYAPPSAVDRCEGRRTVSPVLRNP